MSIVNLLTETAIDSFCVLHSNVVQGLILFYNDTLSCVYYIHAIHKASV